MNLCFDIGNTNVKCAVFDGPALVWKDLWAEADEARIGKIKSGFPGIDRVIICSVRPGDHSFTELIRSSFPLVIVFDHQTGIPIKNLYRTTGTLGKDRLAAVTGASNNYPGRNVFVVDAGTAITYDLIDEFSQYHGGNISPGMSMRFRALHEFTGRLPLVEPAKKTVLLADNTKEAIAAGVENGIIFEIESYVERVKREFRNLIIILTGGDAKFFEKTLKSTIFVDPDLIFTGLNRILNYNAEK